MDLGTRIRIIKRISGYRGTSKHPERNIGTVVKRCAFKDGVLIKFDDPSRPQLSRFETGSRVAVFKRQFGVVSVRSVEIIGKIGPGARIMAALDNRCSDNVKATVLSSNKHIFTCETDAGKRIKVDIARLTPLHIESQDVIKPEPTLIINRCKRCGMKPEMMNSLCSSCILMVIKEYKKPEVPEPIPAYKENS